jgi:methionyl aminopeptidase
MLSSVANCGHDPVRRVYVGDEFQVADAEPTLHSHILADRRRRTRCSRGDIDDAARRLADTTSRALAAGIASAQVGARIGDISHAIETVARDAGYGLPDGLGGHGVGTAMHEEPSVPNTGRAHRGLRLREGLVIAIEPMLIEGGGNACHTLPDGWTIATADGSRAAHAEHTLAITAAGPVILPTA